MKNPSDQGNDYLPAPHSGSCGSFASEERGKVTIPPPKRNYLTSIFEEKKAVPSSPKTNGKSIDTEKPEIEDRMRSLGILPFFLSKESHAKLAYAIEKGLDEKLKREEPMIKRSFRVAQLLRKSTAVGRRFDALYSSHGDDVRSVEPNDKLKDRLYGKHPEWLQDNDENVYLVFQDNEHENLEVFLRVQKSGNCFLQAPILLHWYLSLWFDDKLKPKNVNFVHLSKYVRNTFDTEKLRRYIFLDSGGWSEDEAHILMPGAWTQAVTVISASEASYEDILLYLKERGPALASLTKLHEDFYTNDMYKFHGKPVGKVVDGHAMVLVGVRREQDENKKATICFLFQNFWETKLFVELDREYFFASGGRLFFCSRKALIQPINDKTYAQEAQGVRFAESSCLLERAYKLPRVR